MEHQHRITSAKTKKWKLLPGTFMATKEFEEYANICDDESVEKVETLRATITDAEGGIASAKTKTSNSEPDEHWEVLVTGYFWKNGRPKFKYIVIEKEVEDKGYEVECKKEMWYTVSMTHGPGIDRASHEAEELGRLALPTFTVGASFTEELGRLAYVHIGCLAHRGAW